MKTMKRLLCLFAALTVLLAPLAVLAQPAPAKKCGGPPALCAQILELQEKLEAAKKLDEKKDDKKDVDKAQIGELESKLDAQKALTDQKEAEKVTTVLKTEKKDAENVARMIAFAAVLAIALKTLVSALQSWKGFFTTDKQKAWLKIATLVIGFLAFLLTNIGFGIPWWQAIILAGGGPGAIMVHELMKMIPVLLGKKKYESKSEPPPPDGEKKDEETIPPAPEAPKP